jgi:hypothetical protein
MAANERHVQSMMAGDSGPYTLDAETVTSECDTLARRAVKHEEASLPSGTLFQDR